MAHRRLKTIAKEINDTMPGYSAILSKNDRYDTDKKIGRIVYPRKGLFGNRLRVYKGWEVVFQYHTREYYRTNADVEEWVREEKRELREKEKLA